MKAFISVDLEGMPYIVIPGQLDLKGALHDEARKIATKITLTVADELKKNGFDKVVIADSHGPMVNLLIDDLPEYVEIVRGFPRPLIMVAGEAQLLKDDVERHAPWVETVALKQSLSRLSARSPSMIVIEKELREAVKTAVGKLKRKKPQALVARTPVKTRVTFLTSLYADAAELLPTVERLDALRVEYKSSNMAEAYKTLELLAIAAMGLFRLLDTLR